MSSYESDDGANAAVRQKQNDMSYVDVHFKLCCCKGGMLHVWYVGRVHSLTLIQGGRAGDHSDN